MTRESKSFGPDLWAKGTRGVESPLGGRAYIENMHTYRSGLLGTRPRWKGRYARTTGTEFSQFFPGELNYAGTYYDGIICTHPSNGVLFVSVDGTERGVHASGISCTPNQFAKFTKFEYLINDHVYFVGQNSGPIVGNAAMSRTAVGIAAAYSYNSFVHGGGLVWQGRAWYWGAIQETGTDTTYNRQRLHYSDLYDWTTFTDVGSFDIDGDVAGMMVLDEDLVVWTYDYQYFRLTSSKSPIDAVSITPMGKNRTPLGQGYVTEVDGVNFFISNPAPASSVVPFSRSGQDDEALTYLYPGNGRETGVEARVPVGDGSANMVWLPYKDGDSSTASHLEAFEFVNGNWWNTVESDFLPSEFPQPAGAGINIGPAGVHWLVVANPSLGDWYILTRDSSLDRPSKSDDTWSYTYDEVYLHADNGVVSSTTAGAGSVFLPRLQGVGVNDYVRINNITIDAQYWQVAAEYPDISVTVNVRDHVTSQVIATDLVLGNVADAEPGNIRIKAPCPSLPFTPWSQVELSGINSLALEFVHIDYEVENRSY